MPSPHRPQAIAKILATRGRAHAHQRGKVTKSPAVLSVLALRPMPKKLWSRNARTRQPESARALALHKARPKGH